MQFNRKYKLFFLDFSDYQESDTRDKVTKFFGDWFIRSLEILTGASVKESNPVVTLIRCLDNRNKSILIALVGVFGVIGILMEGLSRFYCPPPFPLQLAGWGLKNRWKKYDLKIRRNMKLNKEINRFY